MPADSSTLEADHSPHGPSGAFTDSSAWSKTDTNTARVTIELNGEIADDPSGAPYFHRGVSSFPPLGAPAHRIRAGDLRAIYAFRGREGVEIAV